MSNDVELESSGRIIGTINFERAPRALTAQRTGAGFELRLPLEINFWTVPDADPVPDSVGPHSAF